MSKRATAVETFWDLLKVLLAIKHKLGVAAVTYDIGIGAAMTLISMNVGQGHSMSELAKKLTCDASVITDNADRLFKAGLIERSENPKDRRAKQLTLTKKGEEVRTDLARQAAASALPGLKDLTDDELETLFRLLDKVTLPRI